ncbi:MAG: radical SAM protein [Oleispira sp.]|nr:radical SAM protein [Oleispira sp.]MBL4880546.1 radical SAM protein [Oleispira sp.]
MEKQYGDYFNLSHVESSSHIYGPGKRFVVWFQGCALACNGCWNKEMWSFKDKLLVQREQLLDRILNTSNIQGVTFLGGEPLHQSSNLWWLIRKIREHSDLTIFLFTGYEQEELESQNNFSNILEFCDIVTLGRYQEDSRNTNQQWIGSDNQSVLYPDNSREAGQPENINQVEIIIEDNESIRILGFPDDMLINEILN